MTILQTIGQGACEICGKLVNVVWGKCQCEPECELETTICGECGCGMTPD